jgi:hypothetical protein
MFVPGRPVIRKTLIENFSIQEMSVNHRLFPVIAFLLSLAVWLPAAARDGSSAGQSASVNGRWLVQWQARLGTEQATIELEQRGSALSGSFHDPRHSCPLSGTIEGKNIAFDVPFQGPRPYTIAFKGVLDADKISGTSQAKNMGSTGAYLGHGGEIVQPEHPWTATRQADPPSLRTQKGKSPRSGNSN